MLCNLKLLNIKLLKFFLLPLTFYNIWQLVVKNWLFEQMFGQEKFVCNKCRYNCACYKLTFWNSFCVKLFAQTTYNSVKYTLLLILFLACLPGCRKQADNYSIKDPSLLRIDAGFECGWGTGADSLIITRSSIKYLYWIPAQSQNPIIDKTRSVSDTEWTSIVNSVNLNEFLLLNYNSCNICVDGCDEWIAIKNDEIFHQIRFGKGLQIDTIKTLQNKLAQLRTEFSR